VCNGHLMAQNRLWAGKPPCCLLTTIASNGLSPGRDLHLGSDHAALRRRACHLCSSCVVRARTEGQITLSWREVTSVQGCDLLCILLQTVPVHGFAAACCNATTQWLSQVHRDQCDGSLAAKPGPARPDGRDLTGLHLASSSCRPMK